MVVINFRKLFKLFFALALFFNASLCAVKNVSSFSVTDIVDDAYNRLGLKKDFGCKYTQTTAYLSDPELYKNLNYTFGDRIKEIGFDFFKDLFKTIIEKEFEFKDEYYVFYHGQKREFALPQNIYEGLYKIIYKKALFDFIMLRVPNKDFSKYGSIKNFLNKYIKNGEIFNHSTWFDTQAHTRRYLLSVNASLFGNTSLAWGGECTFDYFIKGYSITPTDVTDLVLEIFNLFDLDSIFDLYREQIKEMETLLADYENNKTGLLLQIFVPRNMVNKIAYRCYPGGYLYYDDKTPWKHAVSGELDKYQEQLVLGMDGYLFDHAQFRLLINQSMLDPKSGVKVFRYCNETEKFKEYKELLQRLLSQIEQEYGQLKKTPQPHKNIVNKFVAWVKA